MPGKVYDLFFKKGEVVEIRAFGLTGKSQLWEGFAGPKSTIAGYYDNKKDFARDALALDKRKARGVYFTLNPCVPALLARSANCLKVSPSVMKNTTADHDIRCLRWLPIDLDPVRPSGISSSDEELALTKDVAKKVTEFLEGEFGLEKGIRACSGNGYHIVYRLDDLENNGDNKALIKDILMNLEEVCGNEQVNVDLSVFNPARIWKIYGTSARKGDSIKDRPHRKSFLFTDQPTKLKDVPVCQLKD